MNKFIVITLGDPEELIINASVADSSSKGKIICKTRFGGTISLETCLKKEAVERIKNAQWVQQDSAIEVSEIDKNDEENQSKVFWKDVMVATPVPFCPKCKSQVMRTTNVTDQVYGYSCPSCGYIETITSD
jgi:hypothetical protein